MAKLVLYGLHMAARTGITVSASGEAAGFPKEQAADFEIGTFWTDTSNSGDRFYKIDQGPGGSQALDSMIVLAGHNFSGQAVHVESSPDNSAWTSRGNTTPGSSAAFRIKAGSSWTTRYTRLRVTNPTLAPSAPEVIFALSVTLDREVSEPGTSFGKDWNIRTHTADSGEKWGAKRAPSQFHHDYLVRDLSLSNRNAIEQWYEDIDTGANPFPFEDADGVLRWGRLLTELKFQAVAILMYDLRLELQEEL